MKDHLRYSQSIFWLCLLFVIALNGCATSETPVPSLTDTSLPPTDTPIPTNTSSPTVMLSPSHTPTSTITRTPWPTIPITFTPLPTIPPDEALKIILAIYENNGGCELPCWWGITPGETSWQEVHERFSPLLRIGGPFLQRGAHYSFLLDVPNNVDPSGYGFFSANLYFEGDIIQEIIVRALLVTPYFDDSMSGLLAKFGKPAEIWLAVDLETVDFIPSYWLVLFYPQHGITVSMLSSAEKTDNAISLCPQRIYGFNSLRPGLILWPPQEPRSFKEFYYLDNPEDYFLLEEYPTDMDTQTYYETYLDPDTEACFEIDITDLPWNR